MSVSSINVIMERIACATPESPIAVFKLNNPCIGTLLDAVFGNTTMTKVRIAAKDPGFVGLFHGGMDKREVRSQLKKIIAGK